MATSESSWQCNSTPQRCTAACWPGSTQVAVTPYGAYLKLSAAGVCLYALTQSLDSTGHKATLLTIDATLRQQQPQQQWSSPCGWLLQHVRLDSQEQYACRLQAYCVFAIQINRLLPGWQLGSPSD
jgi:hypothetical protein